jgi:hypothetical protein
VESERLAFSPLAHCPYVSLLEPHGRLVGKSGVTPARIVTYVGDPGKSPGRALAGRLRGEAGEEPVEDLLAADLPLALGVVTLLLQCGAKRDGGDEESAGSQMDSKWQSISTGRAQ